MSSENSDTLSFIAVASSMMAAVLIVLVSVVMSSSLILAFTALVVWPAVRRGDMVRRRAALVSLPVVLMIAAPIELLVVAFVPAMLVPIAVLGDGPVRVLLRIERLLEEAVFVFGPIRPVVTVLLLLLAAVGAPGRAAPRPLLVPLLVHCVERLIGPIHPLEVITTQALAVVEQAGPVGVVPQRGAVAEQEEAVARPRDRNIHPAVVGREAQLSLVVASDAREDDDVLLAALIAVDCVDLDVLLRAVGAELVPQQAVQLVLDGANLRLVGRDDADQTLQLLEQLDSLVRRGGPPQRRCLGLDIVRLVAVQ